MSAKWQHRDEGKKISRSVVKSKSTEELRNASSFIQGLLDLRKAEKLQKTYIHGTEKALEYNDNGKVYVDYRLDGTATGRLSCRLCSYGTPSLSSYRQRKEYATCIQFWC